jgi:antitoxin (DNA-binding transcriptional repressor) of toxin-antitoxin stability system
MLIKNIHEAMAHLSHLIELACEGEEVSICKAGKPMVRMTRYQEVL